MVLEQSGIIYSKKKEWKKLDTNPVSIKKWSQNGSYT